MQQRQSISAKLARLFELSGTPAGNNSTDNGPLAYGHALSNIQQMARTVGDNYDWFSNVISMTERPDIKLMQIKENLELTKRSFTQLSSALRDKEKPKDKTNEEAEGESQLARNPSGTERLFTHTDTVRDKYDMLSENRTNASFSSFNVSLGPENLSFLATSHPSLQHGIRRSALSTPNLTPITKIKENGAAHNQLQTKLFDDLHSEPIRRAQSEQYMEDLTEGKEVEAEEELKSDSTVSQIGDDDEVVDRTPAERANSEVSCCAHPLFP